VPLSRGFRYSGHNQTSELKTKLLPSNADVLQTYPGHFVIKTCDRRLAYCKRRLRQFTSGALFNLKGLMSTSSSPGYSQPTTSTCESASSARSAKDFPSYEAASSVASDPVGITDGDDKDSRWDNDKRAPLAGSLLSGSGLKDFVLVSDNGYVMAQKVLAMFAAGIKHTRDSYVVAKAERLIRKILIAFINELYRTACFTKFTLGTQFYLENSFLYRTNDRASVLTVACKKRWSWTSGSPVVDCKNDFSKRHSTLRQQTVEAAVVAHSLVVATLVLEEYSNSKLVVLPLEDALDVA
jgi:hypothetical protein